MLGIVTIMVGIASGLGGMALGLLRRLVQHIAYNYSLHMIVSKESFLQGVAAASDLRRFVALCVCGAIAGLVRRSRRLPCRGRNGLHRQCEPV